MDRLIYTTLSGLQRASEAQAVTAHNLANAQVPGFRREMAALAPAWAVGEGSALTTRVQSGGESPHDLLHAGRTEVTGAPLDIAMDGGAWLAVQRGDGTEGLTRRGDLRIDGEGRLLTGDGRPVLSDEGPVLLPPNASDIGIDRAGRVTARLTQEGPPITLARLRLVSPEPATLKREADGLFTTAEPLPGDPLASVTPGAIERSNVEPTAALIELIQQSRQFEMQTKLLSTARELDEGSAALMRIE